MGLSIGMNGEEDYKYVIIHSNEDIGVDMKLFIGIGIDGLEWGSKYIKI